MITEIALIKDGEPEIFNVDINLKNYLKAKGRLLLEWQRINEQLKVYKDKGIIKTISRPSNKQHQTNLDKLVLVRKIIRRAIKKINALYY